ncbi:MAG TPA: hypothetical protein VFQ13_23890 [Anaerolineales bacterium]|nr:hypothetical protein [Anaerolineales bacterium]
MDYIQISAAAGLGLSYFLPLSQSLGTDEVNYADDAWVFFFWAIPVLFVIFKVSNRWLKAVLCFLSAMGGLLDLIAISFAGTFKRTPLIGFHIAKASIIILVISWFILCAILLATPKHNQAEN